MKKLLNIKSFGSPHETADVFEKKLLKCGCKKNNCKTNQCTCKKNNKFYDTSCSYLRCENQEPNNHQ